MKTLFDYILEAEYNEAEYEKLGSEAFDNLIEIVNRNINLKQPNAQDIMNVVLPKRNHLGEELIQAGFTLPEDEPTYQRRYYGWWKKVGRGNDQYILLKYKGKLMCVIVGEDENNGNMTALVNNQKYWAWLSVTKLNRNLGPGYCFGSKREDATHNSTRKEYYA